MKKIIGIIGITVFSMAMFLNTNNNSNDVNLANLIALNTANAEGGTISCKTTAGTCYAIVYSDGTIVLIPGERIVPPIRI